MYTGKNYSRVQRSIFLIRAFIFFEFESNNNEIPFFPIIV